MPSKLLLFSNAIGMKKRQNGYNLATTGMLPNFGKPAAAPAGSISQTTSVPLASTVLAVLFAWLKKLSAAAKRVLLKPEEPQPFAAPQDKKSYQVFRRLPTQDEVRHVATPTQSRLEPTAEVFTDNQQLGQQIKPTLWDKFAKTLKRDAAPLAVETAAVIDVPETEAQARHPFSATCPGKREVNPIADAFEQRMAEKKTVAPVAPNASKVAAPVLNTAAKPEIKQSVPSKLRNAIFGRKQKAAQPAIQGEFALDNVRPLRNDLSDADLEVVSSVTKMVGKGNLQTVTDEKAQSTAPSRRAPKSDSAINSAAETPQAEPTPELIARV
jgi:hypothetical protein